MMKPHTHHSDINDEILEMVVKDISFDQYSKDVFIPITLDTTRGKVHYRYFKVPNATKTVIFVGDARQGWNSPGTTTLFSDIGQDLIEQGISSLWVEYRRPTNIIESILDVLAGIYFIRSQGTASISIVGHSFGGAVAIQAAASSSHISSLITVGTQGYGTEAALRLPEQCSALIIHGLDDEIVSPLHSIKTYNLIPSSNKEIILLPKARHAFTEVSAELKELIVNWFIQSK